MARSRSGITATAMTVATAVTDRLLGQHVRIGVLPQVYAATAPDVRGGEYYGPDGYREMRGHPHRVPIPTPGQDTGVAAKLWDLTADLTKVDPDPA
jgi:protochlorophyllide reductase